jgi:putative ABC transport system permease protein
MPGYFETMRIPIVRGRTITEADRRGALPVVLVNEFLARTYWPGENPIGKRITLAPPGKEDWRTVVGVVRDTIRNDWQERPAEEVFVPYLQEPSYLTKSTQPFNYITLVLRTDGPPGAVAPALRAAIADLDRAAAVSEVQSMEDVVSNATAEPRFNLLLLSSFATVALVLAAIGIYGVMSYSVSRRTHEIGIRMSLGATPGDVLGVIVREGMALAGIGAAAGITAAFVLSRSMEKLLYGVRPTDPVTFGGVTLVLVLVSLVATYVPARRATSIDPVAALRGE